MSNLPEPWSEWVHIKTGKKYRVITVANRQATRPRWPVTVVYEDDQGRIWSRPHSEWKFWYDKIS